MNVNWKLMKITNSGHKKVGLLNQKMIKEKLMKKAYTYMFLVKKATDNLWIKLVTLKN